MSEEYPPYVRRLLDEAQALLDEDDYGQADAAALCFEVLALFPDNQIAAELVYRAFSDPWLIRDNRKAIGRHIDEWDDRAWQQRRRLALSFRYMSRWEGRHWQYEADAPSEVAEMLEEGRHQLLQDYLLGQSRGSEVAWSIFQEAIRRSSDPAEVMLWVGHLYADQGYFAESIEVLADLLAGYPHTDGARRLWAEVRWWRDNQQRIPWIPPADSSDGSRFRRMIARVDPDFADEELDPAAMLEYFPPDQANLPADFEVPPPLPDELRDKIEAALAQTITSPVGESPVDWSYLDALESGEIDVTQFPEWAQHLLLEIDDPEQAAFMQQYLLSYLANPPLPEEEDDDFFDEPDLEDE